MTNDSNRSKFDVSAVNKPTVTLTDWDSETITLTVLGNNESGSFRRARMWLNRNSNVPVEPDNGREPISVEEVGMTDSFVRKWSYRFKKLEDADD